MSAMPFVAAFPFVLVGVHLARVAVRSGALPDRLLAGFFLLCAAGIPPRMMAVDMATAGVGLNATAFWLTSAANLVIGSALVSLAAFAWKVFRADAAWARNLVIAFAIGIFATFSASMTSLEASSGSGPLAILFNGFGSFALGWTFLECLLYYRVQSRRRALGLADPIIANRFMLWSIWTGAIAVQTTLTILLRTGIWWSGAGELLQAGMDPGGPWLALISVAKGAIGIVGPAVVISVFLSFSPPAAYRSWLQSRHAQPAL